jgi:hypothetical protein
MTLTPKEKSKELFDKYYDIDDFGYSRGEDSFIYWSTEVLKKQSKQCALIAVDEIMYNNLMDYPQHSTIFSPHKNDYWQQVKQEINKL